MKNKDVQLVSTITCDDALLNAAGRVTLYSIFHDFAADAYPTLLTRLHVTTTWLNPSSVERQVVQRVALLQPNGELVADAATTITVAPGSYHTQISRFRDLLFPEPGIYRLQVQAHTQLVADIPVFAISTAPAPAEGEGV